MPANHGRLILSQSKMTGKPGWVSNQSSSVEHGREARRGVNSHRKDGSSGIGDVLGEVLPPRLLFPDSHLLLDLDSKL